MKILKWFKKHWILSLFLFVYSVPAGLNYSGFCWEEKRWLSDDERIRSMIDYENRSSVAVVNDNGKIRIPVKRIAYKSVDEFLGKNPDCCKVGYKYTAEHSNDGYYWPFSFVDYMFFFGGDVVTLYYLENYFNEDNIARSQMKLSIYAVSNCGKNIN